MADSDRAPVRTVADVNARNRDFYTIPPPPQRREDGSVVDERFQRPEDELFRRQPGRK